MTADEAKDAINEILIQEFEIDPQLLRPQVNIYEELQIDSLDAVDLIVTIEKRFGCRIEEEKARSMRTLGDIYDYVEQQVADGVRETEA